MFASRCSFTVWPCQNDPDKPVRCQAAGADQRGEQYVQLPGGIADEKLFCLQNVSGNEQHHEHNAGAQVGGLFCYLAGRILPESLRGFTHDAAGKSRAGTNRTVNQLPRLGDKHKDQSAGQRDGGRAADALDVHIVLPRLNRIVQTIWPPVWPL